MFDNTLLAPFNKCQHMVVEKHVKHVFGKAVKIFKCDHTRKVRLVAYNEMREPVSALLINPHHMVRTYHIDAVFTTESHRRQGMARQLLAVARFIYGSVYHSDNLTIEGEKWRDSVEGINSK